MINGLTLSENTAQHLLVCFTNLLLGIFYN
jgi:hypothetical protein